NRAREKVRDNAGIRGFTSPAKSFRPAGTIHQRYDRGPGIAQRREEFLNCLTAWASPRAFTRNEIH
ncbi:hypothetical protein, partial [Rubripirellula obstinata]|uniref:hypothetical protein n=1 Tax=Rubripirellula obstinata TaxID=406547 RepID=UPI001EE43AD9